MKAKGRLNFRPFDFVCLLKARFICNNLIKRRPVIQLDYEDLNWRESHAGRNLGG